MRELTLHEKISFKGALIKHGFDYKSELIKLSMKSMMHYWNMFYYTKPFTYCFKIPHRRNYGTYSESNRNKR